MDNQDWLQQQLKSLDGPIADDGFTDQVMAKLERQRLTVKPRAALKSAVFAVELWVVILALVLGIAIALFNLPVVELSTWLVEQNTKFVLVSKTLASSIGLLLITGGIVTVASCGWSLMQLR